MKKLLITGASGFLGYNFLQTDLTRWHVVAMGHQRQLPPVNVEMISCDIADMQALLQALEITQPDAIVHLAAMSNTLFCEDHPGLSHQINVQATVQIAEWCGRRAIPLLFTSTDLVFDGMKGHYTEADTINPLSLYGKQKAEAEKQILALCPHACILRMPLMFGYGGKHARSFMQEFLQKLQRGQSLYLFIDEYRSIVGGRSAAQGIWLALHKHWQGIYHLGGRQKISRYEFGVMMCDFFGISTQLIIPALQKDIPLKPPRPSDVSLNSEKAYRSGYKPLLVSEELREVARWMQHVS